MATPAAGPLTCHSTEPRLAVPGRDRHVTQPRIRAPRRLRDDSQADSESADSLHPLHAESPYAAGRGRELCQPALSTDTRHDTMPAATETTNSPTGPDAPLRADRHESWANSLASPGLPADAISSATTYTTSSAMHAPSFFGPVGVSTTVASSNSSKHHCGVSMGSSAINPAVQPSKRRAQHRASGSCPRRAPDGPSTATDHQSRCGSPRPATTRPGRPLPSRCIACAPSSPTISTHRGERGR